MVTQPAKDTDYAMTLADLMTTNISTYSVTQERLFPVVDKIPITYGRTNVVRPISDPNKQVAIAKVFQRQGKQTPKLVQHLDHACVSNDFSVPRVEFAGDPANVNNHARDQASILLDSIEKVFIEGESGRVLIYGVYDFPDGTGGVVNRPEALDDTTDGDWSTIANMISDFVKATTALGLKGFYGPYLGLAPIGIKPMFAAPIASTAVAVKNWITGSLGLPIAYSPFVHQGATKDDFNIILIDQSKIHMALSDLKVDSYYEQKDHAHYWDWEIYENIYFDPIYDGTEYIKGVVRLDARDWND